MLACRCCWWRIPNGHCFQPQIAGTIVAAPLRDRRMRKPPMPKLRHGNFSHSMQVRARYLLLQLAGICVMLWLRPSVLCSHQPLRSHNMLSFPLSSPMHTALCKHKQPAYNPQATRHIAIHARTRCIAVHAGKAQYAVTDCSAGKEHHRSRLARDV